MTKALIIGGGIAGTLTAIGLHEVGVRAEVHEAHGGAADGVGLFLTLAANGLATLEPLGLAGVVGALGFRTPSMRLISGRTGRELGTAGMDARTLNRGDLYQALHTEAVRRGIPIHYGRRLADAAREGAGVVARFEDGSTATGDLLVGADGLRSRTRSVIDPGAPAPRRIGLLNTGGWAHDLRLGGEPGVANFLFGRECFFGWFEHPDGGVWWFANPPSPKDAVPEVAWRGRLEAMFAGDHGPMLEIIAASDDIFPPWETYDFPRVPVWHRDRMIIVGDAAHATSPSAGQGASMAMEDAVMLARCLRDHPDPDVAFVAFEAARRERVERVVAQGKRNGSGKAAGPVGARIRDAIMPTVVRRFASAQALAWMTDHRIDWHTEAGASSQQVSRNAADTPGCGEDLRGEAARRRRRAEHP
jgi:2-polyprenyl-6-methoxyphenol hydroxylase-like FAD-dependent oxidoreductase